MEGFLGSSGAREKKTGRIYTSLGLEFVNVKISMN